MKISQDDYFYYERLLLEKGIAAEKAKRLKATEWLGLKREYEVFKSKLRG